MPQADNTEDVTDVTQTEDTTVSEDTSTKEETQDTEDDFSLEDDDTSFEDEDDDETEEAEDSEDEKTDTEPTETEEESKEDEDTEEQSDESEESAEDTTAEEERKRYNADMAAKRIAEKQARDQAKYQQQQEYLQEAEDAKDLALRQLQVDAYNNKVESNKSKLESGIEKAVAGIDLFREGSPEVKEELARRIEDFEAKHVQYDTNGDPVQVTGDVYEYLQREADSIQRILNTGARQQTKAKNNAKSRTEPLPSRAPKEPPVDPDLAAFDEEVAKWA
jgi:hypothetical protein